jgi:signal transduction histidine kinase
MAEFLNNSEEALIETTQDQAIFVKDAGRTEPKVNILLVDDRPENLLALSAVLDSLGENLVKASSGLEALKCLLNQDFAVILIDVQMPGMDGFETATLIRERERSRHTPIMFITGFNQSDTHVFKGYSLGAVDYILKPCEPEILKLKVAVFISLFKKTEEVKRQAVRLEAANKKLEVEITSRQQAEEALQQSYSKCEIIVTNRTAELAKANAEIQKALEKEKELSNLKSRFVTMASHEFRTPLTTILSSAALLEKYSHKLAEEKKINHLQRIQAAVQHMTGLLNDVLLIGKAEAGKLEFQPTPLDLAQFCRELVEEMQQTTDTHTIAFRIQNQGTTACMDEKLLRLIFSNLLSNAIKYSPQGGVVDFDLVYKPQAVIFYIQDRGIGIPIAEQAQMFDSFHRASNVGTISGTGLGLAIVKKAVDLHGGKIAVKSEVAAGTTFTVTLPLSESCINN